MGPHLPGMFAQPAFARGAFTVLFDLPVLGHDLLRRQGDAPRLAGADDDRCQGGMIIERLAIAALAGKTVVAMNSCGRKGVRASESHQELIAKDAKMCQHAVLFKEHKDRHKHGIKVARRDRSEPRADLIVTGSLLPIGEEEERSIGASLALQVVTRYGGIYERPELTRYVNLVGQGVALTCNRANLDYHFAILNHDSINAFATPAGYVFITKGLLQHLQNEAELATVLGHEIAHISEKHLLSILQREKQIAGITEAGLTYVNQNPALFKGLIDAVAKKLLDEGLDQGKELEADRLGMGFAARVGYEPTAYRTLLQRLRAIRGDDRAFFKTHPNFSTRLTEVDGVLGAQHLQSTGVLLPERFLSNLEGRL